MTTVKSNGNVFKTLGFNTEEAENLKVRSQLMIELKKYIKDNKLTQSNAADLFNVSQPRISSLVTGKIDKFTIDMLVNMLGKTGQSVVITIKAA